MEEDRTVNSIAIIAECSDKKIRQVVLTKKECDLILKYLYRLNDFHKLQVFENTLDDIKLY